MKFPVLVVCAILLVVGAAPVQAGLVYTINNPYITLHQGETATLSVTVLNTSYYDVSFHSMSFTCIAGTVGQNCLPSVRTLYTDQSYTWDAFTLTALSTAQLGTYTLPTQVAWCDTNTRKYVFYRTADYHLTVVPEPAGCLPLALGLVSAMGFIHRRTNPHSA